MPREIKSPENKIEVSRSFDGKHELQYSDTSHRYKLDGKPVVGTTTFIKASLPTSVGLMNWQKTEAMKSIFNSVSTFQDGNFIPRGDVWPISEQFLKDLLKLNRDTHEEVAREAADIGTVTHSVAELHGLGKIDEATTLLDKVKGVEKWPVIKTCVDKYLDWAAGNQGELISAEGLIASPTYLFCGKIDRLVKINGKYRIQDFKTSKDIYPDQYVQQAAYAIAVKEWWGYDVEELEIVRFGKDDGAFETLVIHDPKEVQMFKDQVIRCRATFDFLKIGNDARFNWKTKQAAKGK